MALFMVLTVIVGSQIVLRNMATVSRSQREADVIWRGNQYARAIKMYYHKTGHFPQTQDDLVTGVPGVHFLRSEVMKDPMNTQDGAWRFIYTNGSGAIIGSVKYGSLLQMAMMDMNGGKMPGQQQATNGTDSNSQSSSQSSSQGTATSTGSSSTSTNSGSGPGGGGFSLNSVGPGSGSGNGAGSLLSNSGNFTNNTPVGPAPTGPVTGTVFGGQLIGVGSTVDRTSVRIYKGGTKYNQWEFIWNPLEEQAQAIQQGIGAAGAPGGIPGLGLPIANPGGNGFSTSIGAGSNPANGGTTANPTANGGDSGNSNPAGSTNTSGNSNSPNGTNNTSTPNNNPPPTQ
ncbi:MAG TPA: hypothetical protein VIY69_15175 [Candidatus Acidoferrales bacterium]